MTSQGPNLAGAGQDVNIGGTAWTNPANAASTVSFATVALSGGGTSNYLFASQFGFTIPLASVIVGIQATIKEGFTGTPASGGGIADALVQLGLNSTTAIGSDLGSHNAIAPTPAVHTYGSSTNLWGTTFTPTQVNASTFGIFLDYQNTDSAALTGEANSFNLTVFYQPPGASWVASVTLSARGVSLVTRAATWSPSATFAPLPLYSTFGGIPGLSMPGKFEPAGRFPVGPFTYGYATPTGIPALGGGGFFEPGRGPVATGSALSITAAASFAATGKALGIGRATWSPSASFAAVGRSQALRTYSVTAAASPAFVGRSLFRSAATWVASASAAFIGRSSNRSTATWLAAATAAFTGKSTARGTATWSPIATAAFVGGSLDKGAYAITAASSMAAVGKSTARSTATWPGAAAASFSGITVRITHFIITAASTLLFIPPGNYLASFVSRATLVGVGRAITRAVASWTASATFSAVGRSQFRSTATWQPSATFIPIGAPVVRGSAAITSAASLSAVGRPLAKGAYSATGSASLSAHGRSTATGVASLVAAAVLLAGGVRARVGAFAASGAALFAARGQAAFVSRFTATGGSALAFQSSRISSAALTVHAGSVVLFVGPAFPSVQLKGSYTAPAGLQGIEQAPGVAGGVAQITLMGREGNALSLSALINTISLKATVEE